MARRSIEKSEWLRMHVIVVNGMTGIDADV
jgi:hypothetical protein